MWVPGSQHLSLRPLLPAPPKLSCRSVGLISGAHRLRRCGLAFRAWLHLSDAGRTRGRPLAPSSTLRHKAGKKPRKGVPSHWTHPVPADPQSTTRLNRKVATERHHPAQFGILETAQQTMNGRGQAPGAPLTSPAEGLLGSPTSPALSGTLPLATCHLPDQSLCETPGFLL